MKFLLIVVPLAGLLACGCVSTDSPRLDAAIGKSTAQMVEAQTFDAAAAAHPVANAPQVGDGQRLKNAVDANRKDVGKGAPEVARPIIFEVGR
jgi:hypothetical protein